MNNNQRNILIIVLLGVIMILFIVMYNYTGEKVEYNDNVNKEIHMNDKGEDTSWYYSDITIN